MKNLKKNYSTCFLQMEFRHPLKLPFPYYEVAMTFILVRIEMLICYLRLILCQLKLLFIHPNYLQTYLRIFFAKSSSWFFIICISNAGYSQCSNSISDPINNGLVAFYPFNGNAQDLSLFGNHGTVVGPSLTTDRFGNMNSAYYFDGINDGIEIPRSTSLEPISAMSACAWVLREANPNVWNPVLSKRYSIPDPYNSYSIDGGSDTNNRWMANICKGTVGSQTSVFSQNPRPLNQWEFIVMTYDGQKLTMYINGVEDNSVPLTGNIGYSSMDFYIGKNTVFDQFFKGKIDDVRIYNRALSSCEVKYLYNNCQAATTSDLITTTTITTCVGKQETITTNFSSYSYQWSPISLFSNPNSNQPTFTANQSQYIYVRGNDGSCDYYDSVWVEVIQATVNVNGPFSICHGDSIQLQASGAQNYTWDWNITLSDTNIATPIAKPLTTTLYRVKGMVNGCLASNTILVTVAGQLNLDAGNDTLVCIGDTLGLRAIGGSAFTWTPTQNIIDANTSNPLVFPTTPTWYKVTSTSGTCMAYDSVFVDVKTKPQLSINDTLFCREQSFTPNIANQSGIDKVRWQPTTFLSASNVLNPVITAANTIGYNITAISDAGCEIADSFYVVVSTVKADFSIENNPIEIPGELKVVNQSSGNNLLYNWYINQQPWSSINSPQQDITDTGIYVIKLRVMNAHGCLDSIEKVLLARNELRVFIPNVFTPNGDKVNDKFTFRLDMSMISSLDGSIWNRWGDKIAEFTGKNDDWWDGTSNGKFCSDGVYFFMVNITDYKGNFITYHGSVTLIR